ncbi:MAG: FMN-binding negative transcriptional regulator [Propioniciclava sp.]|uniref:FMN-binding negative transcriptional regulator n=1 Tax=Propioniciclava sp. TaxID=2038686 RepID=UPI0039E5CC18
MYTPRHFAMDDDQVRALLASAETAQLVTAHAHGPVATLLPVVWRPDPTGETLGSLVLHVTRVNPVWKEPYLGEALAILSGPDGYIHADWYASNETKPGVPTWNYVTVHAYGPLVVRDDADWLREAVWELSDRFGYDSRRAGEEATERMLRAIVGLELPISRFEAKAKLNQNRTPEDIQGAIDGLRGVGHDELADVMTQVSVPHAEARQQLLADVRGRRLGEARPAGGPTLT